MLAPMRWKKLRRERGLTGASSLPGTPTRAEGEVQVFLHRRPDGPRWTGVIEVVELVRGRRAVTRNLGSSYDGGGVLEVEPMGERASRVTQELWVVLPAMTPVSHVDAYRTQLGQVAGNGIGRLEIGMRVDVPAQRDDRSLVGPRVRDELDGVEPEVVDVVSRRR